MPYTYYELQTAQQKIYRAWRYLRALAEHHDGDTAAMETLMQAAIQVTNDTNEAFTNWIEFR